MFFLHAHQSPNDARRTGERDRARPWAGHTVSMACSSPDEATSSLPSSLMPNPNAPHTPLNADVGVTYTAGMHDQLVAQVLLTYARGGDCAALGVPHHVDRTLPLPMAGHVYLQTTSQWEGKHFRSEQKRPRIPDCMRCVPHHGDIPQSR